MSKRQKRCQAIVILIDVKTFVLFSVPLVQASPSLTPVTYGQMEAPQSTQETTMQRENFIPQARLTRGSANECKMDWTSVERTIL